MSEDRHGVAEISHVVVVGLMGSGKTTVGRELASRLGWPLRDSDPEIEAATGRTVRTLRDEIGVDAMHELEAHQLLDALAAPGPAVVSPAASVIDVAACRSALQAPGVAIVFLTVDAGRRSGPLRERAAPPVVRRRPGGVPRGAGR